MEPRPNMPRKFKVSFPIIASIVTNKQDVGTAF